MKPRVLIVDDSWAMRQTLRLLLSPDFDCVVAEDGPSALTQARSHPPDLILSDVSMAGMDGFELCRQVRAEPPLQQVPFVFLSGYEPRSGTTEPGHVYLIKPVRPELLVSRLHELLAPRRDMRPSTGS